MEQHFKFSAALLENSIQKLNFKKIDLEIRRDILRKQKTTALDKLRGLSPSHADTLEEIKLLTRRHELIDRQSADAQEFQDFLELYSSSISKEAASRMLREQEDIRKDGQAEKLRIRSNVEASIQSLPLAVRSKYGKQLMKALAQKI